MRSSEQPDVDPGRDILGRIDVASETLQYRYVYHQDYGRQRQMPLLGHVLVQQGTEQIDYGEPLEYAQDPYTLEGEGSVNQFAHAAQGHAYDVDQHGAAENLDVGGLAVALVLTQRETHRHSHYEHEERECEVGRGEPVPGRVAQGRENVPAAGIVYENHPRHYSLDTFSGLKCCCHFAVTSHP